MNRITFALFAILSLIVFAACAGGDASIADSATPNKVEPMPQPTPSNKFTPADIAKLKWIEGTWRGMDGDKPFYERYRIDGTALVVEGLKEDGSLDGEPGRFELKNGEFGKTEGDRRSAASEITDSYVQFVPAAGSKGNNFRFERQSDGSWIAVLEWAATANKPAGKKIYKMETWEPKK